MLNYLIYNRNILFLRFLWGGVCPFANTMDLIKIQIPSVLVRSNALILNWFGDYRSLHFLCSYFGSRIFYWKIKQKG